MAIDSFDPNFKYDAHLNAVDTRTANRLMALDPEERGVDNLGVPLVHIGLTGSADLHDGKTMHERREDESGTTIRTTLPVESGIDSANR